MITKPTVLILGAGASINYGLPNGLQLKAEICREIQNKRTIYKDLVLFKDDDVHVSATLPPHFSTSPFILPQKRIILICSTQVTYSIFGLYPANLFKCKVIPPLPRNSNSGQARMYCYPYFFRIQPATESRRLEHKSQLYYLSGSHRRQQENMEGVNRRIGTILLSEIER